MYSSMLYLFWACLAVVTVSRTPIAAAISPLASTTTVSWQSAFWPLVPIALGSMTQPAGTLFGRFLLLTRESACAVHP